MKFTTLDIGNTHSRIQYWQNFEKVGDITSFNPEYIADEAEMIVSNVTQKLINTNRAISIKDHLKDGKLIDMPVDYAQSIGADRLALAYAVFKNKPVIEKGAVVIDAGTFITIDLVTQDGLRGGFILPGYQTLANSYQNGKMLPHLTIASQTNFTQLPHTTEDAILSSIHLMLDNAITAILEGWSNQYKTLIITGGDGPIIHKNRATSILTPDLIHQGLKEFYKTIKGVV